MPIIRYSALFWSITAYFWAKLMKFMLTGLFADKPVYRKFLILVSLILFSTIIFSLCGGLVVEYLYGFDVINDAASLSDFGNPEVVSALKVLQLITTGLGMFLVPSLVASLVFSFQPREFLFAKTIPSFRMIALTVVLMFSMVPVINTLMVFNELLELPPFLSWLEQWMKSSEAQAMKITEAFLDVNTTRALMFNILVIAILPALGEEFLFRGVLQKLFHQLTGNIHVTIIITAALFSAIHMQFYGFLPRFLLGLLFGYLLFWSGSIWLPVAAHFINNGAAVVLAYLSATGQLSFNQDTIGTGDGEFIFLAVSVLLSAFIVAMLYRISKKNLPDEETLQL